MARFVLFSLLALVAVAALPAENQEREADATQLEAHAKRFAVERVCPAGSSCRAGCSQNAHLTGDTSNCDGCYCDPTVACNHLC